MTAIISRTVRGLGGIQAFFPGRDLVAEHVGTPDSRARIEAAQASPEGMDSLLDLMILRAHRCLDQVWAAAGLPPEQVRTHVQRDVAGQEAIAGRGNQGNKGWHGRPGSAGVPAGTANDQANEQSVNDAPWPPHAPANEDVGAPCFFLPNHRVAMTSTVKPLR